MAHLALYLFGPFQATLDGNEVTTFATDKARALLAYLAVESGRPHRRDSLAGLLWPDLAQEKARQSLRQTLSRVRRALDHHGPAQPLLLVRQEQVQFHAAGDVWVDVATFTTLTADCRAHAHRSVGGCRPCLERLERAVALYGGDFLDQFFLPDSAAFEEWALLKRDALRQQAMAALEVLATYHERRAEYEQAQHYAWRQIELEPWCEEAHRRLMRVLALTGKRSAALAQYEACRRALDEMLSVEPMVETAALHERIRAGLPAGAPPPHNLPPAPTPFVGRERDLADLAGLLANPDVRLVTLVGPGGIGKTRLALQAAADQAGTMAHGIYVVQLAAARTVEAVTLAIAEALGGELAGRETPREQLLAYLREKECLLVLDNMEHVLEATDLLADILHQAPGVLLLATSRERLNLREEWVYRLRGLPYPRLEEKRVGDYDAPVLFIQSARRVAHDFDPAAEAADITRICQLVEGLPLAIELAAAWAPTQRCEEIADAIAHNLDVLASSLTNVPKRHRSIRATFAHSWEMLSAPEQSLFRRLAVFRGGFTPEAAERAAGTGSEALAALETKSMLRRDADGRYQLHELLRQYAAEQLAAAGEQETAQERHGAYYAGFLCDRAERLRSQSQQEALAEIAAEIENVRAAWQWAIAQRDEAAIGAALTGLDLFYELHSWYHEGLVAFAQAAEALQSHESSGRVLQQALARQARFAQRLGQNEWAGVLLARCLDLVEDRREEALALNLLGEVHVDSGDYATARASLEQALAISEALDDAYGQACALAVLGDVASLQGDYDAARGYGSRGLHQSQAAGAPLSMASALSNLGRIAAIQGDYAAAGEQFQAGLEIYRQLGNRRGTAGCLNNLGSLAYLAGEYERARQLRQETLAICEEIGFRWGVANTLKNLGDIARRLERTGEAQGYLERALETQRQMGDLRAQANTLNSLGALAQDQGVLDVAAQRFRQSLSLAIESGALPVAVDVLSRLAAILAVQGRHADALELNAFVLAHPAGEGQTRDRAEALHGELAGRLAPGAVAAAEARGREATLEETTTRLLDCFPA